MYRSKEKVPSVYSMVSELNKSELKLVYFLFGEDHFTLNGAVKVIEEKAKPFITTDFDKEIISAEKKENVSGLIDLAYTFPFGSEKKLLIVKNFENYNNKKQILSYLESATDTTILVLINYGSIGSLNSEPYKTLLAKNMIFQASELKGRDLENWVKKRCTQLGFDISSESTKSLIEIVGEDKSLLEMQLQKFQSFLSESKEITPEDIKKLSSATKEYSIFDLLNAMGKGNKANALKVLNNLLENGKDLIFIISMLTKYFSVISQSFELRKRKLSDEDASKAIGVSKYYYINCKNAPFFNNETRLIHASKVLYETDLALKTSGIDQKSLSTIMLTNILLD